MSGGGGCSSGKKFRFQAKVSAWVEGREKLGKGFYEGIHGSFIQDLPLLQIRIKKNILQGVEVDSAVISSAGDIYSLGIGFIVHSEKELIDLKEHADSGAVARCLEEFAENYGINLAAGLEFQEKIRFSFKVDKKTYRRGLLELCDEDEEEEEERQNQQASGMEDKGTAPIATGPPNPENSGGQLNKKTGISHETSTVDKNDTRPNTGKTPNKQVTEKTASSCLTSSVEAKDPSKTNLPAAEGKQVQKQDPVGKRDNKTGKNVDVTKGVNKTGKQIPANVVGSTTGEKDTTDTMERNDGAEIQVFKESVSEKEASSEPGDEPFSEKETNHNQKMASTTEQAPTRTGGSDSPIQQPWFISKRFVMYVPEFPNHARVTEVVLKSSNCKTIDGLALSRVSLSEGLFEVVAAIPCDFDLEKISYCYWVTVWEPKWFGTRWNKLPPYKTVMRRMTSKPVQRDIYDDCYNEGLYYHLRHILEASAVNRNVTIKEGVMDMEAFDYRTLSIKDAVYITDRLSTHVEWNLPVSVLTFAAAMGKVFLSPSSLRKQEAITPEIARAILDSFRSYKASDLPASAMTFFPALSKELAKIVYGQNYCFLTWMSQTCMFFSIELLNKELMEVIKSRNQFTVGDASTHLIHAQQLCLFLYQEAPSAPCSVTEDVLERLFRHLPDTIKVPVYHFMVSSVVQGKKTEVWQKIHDTVKVSLKATLSNAKAKGDFDEIHGLWMLIKDVHGLSHVLREGIEGAIMEMLETARNETKACGVLRDFCLEHKLFFNIPEQQKLLAKLAGSKKKSMHRLFLTFLQDEKFYSCGSCLDTGVLQGWIEMCFTHSFDSSYRRYQDGLPKVYSLLCDLLCLPCFKKREDVVQIIEDKMLKKFFHHLTPKEILQKASDIEELSEKKPCAEQLFSSHMQKLLPEKLGTKKQHEVLMELCGTQGKLLVNSRTTANLLTTILNFYTLDPKAEVTETFLTMVRNSQYWLSLFQVTGKESATIRKHVCLDLGLKCLMTILQAFSTGEISCSYVEKLDSEREMGFKKVKDLLAVTGDSRLRNFDKLWKEALQGIQNEKEKVRLVRTVMKSIEREMLQKHLPKGFLEVNDYVRSVEDKLQKGKLLMKELDDKKSLWVKLAKFPSVCTFLELPLQSKVFWNVCQEDILHELLTLSDDGEKEPEEESEGTLAGLLSAKYFEEEEIIKEVDSEIDVIPTLNLLSALQEIGWLKYKESWEAINKIDSAPMNLVLQMFSRNANILNELELAEKLLRCPVKDVSKDALLKISHFEDYSYTVASMKASLKAFQVDVSLDHGFTSAVLAFENLQEGDVTKLKLKEVGLALNTVYSVAAVVKKDPGTVPILDALGSSESLIDFLRKVVDEDIRNLIDAVEEVSEQHVRESTVSGLIEVKRFLQPLLKKTFDTNANSFFRSIAKQCADCISKKIPEQIQDCMDNLHNLKSLYNNVANRGEMTKEIVENVVRKGKFHFSMEKGSHCDFRVNYKQEKKQVSHSRAALVDLRSRSLLLMNTEKKQILSIASKRKDHLEAFIKYVDLALEIGQLCTKMQQSGHFMYEQLERKEDPSRLEDVKNSLESEYESWSWKLKSCRQEYYTMNYVYGSQIQALFTYFEKGLEEKKVDILLKFIHPNMMVKGLRSYFLALEELSPDPHLNLLMKIGHTLQFGCKDLKPVLRQSGLESRTRKLTDVVHSGRLHLVALEENSMQVLSTILALYHNTTGRLPDPSQILFCSRTTSLDELHLILQRCAGAQIEDKNLYCIANVEMLSSENQFCLVAALREMSDVRRYFLAIVCRGSDNHPFINELSDCVVNVRPLTDKEFRTILANVCPEVTTITSDVPGQGKTEMVYKKAHERKKQVVSLHISGPFAKRNLVERLASLRIMSSNVLHIDINRVDNPVALDTFLFELIVLGYVSAGTVSVYLPTNDIFIEIGNTIGHSLRNSLQTAICFRGTNLKWMDFRDFTVSKEINSPVQVVCHYLHSLETGGLDKKDIHFSGKNTAVPLSAKLCRSLLSRSFSCVEDMSFITANIFISVLSDQMKKMSCSSFFRTSNISAMLGRKQIHAVKSNLVTALIDVCKEFASRSVTSCRSAQEDTLLKEVDSGEEFGKELTTGESAVGRVSGMIGWEDSNHLIFVFHNQDIQTISAMYRDMSKIDPRIKSLFEGQMKKSLPDFRKMTQDQLQDILQRVARTNPRPLEKSKLEELASGYALTPDNLLKMVLIMLRIKAHVPVLIMGETGCGKTSLIKYLSDICEVDFRVVSIHAGIDEKTILERVMEVDTEAHSDLKKEFWMFLDEVNTCDHLGLINDIVCHHSCLGTTLSPNLILLAACNPYKLRSHSAIFTAGLQDKARTDELSRLVYRVHPLPETIVDFVWDFGRLNDQDEEAYIHRMVENVYPDQSHCTLFADLLVMSQRFVRETDCSDCSTSLRDVSRCRLLAFWFMDIIERKAKLRSSYIFISNEELARKSMILSLAHCYHSRFSSTKSRETYRDRVADVFSCYKYIYTGAEIGRVIKKEQEDILDRMELPPGTAKNTALRENVFVILVCILNRIPIFVVGKPGCSKSLSMQVIRSSLRGKDSKDALFKTLPQLCCVSFQGSESSTSDGIIKVFEKAENYQKEYNAEEVLSVVILDEIGLAEVSRFNPLKVLHSLLEPVGKAVPNVAVVGISNWALDAAKMNRAIHLSRPEMDLQELIETGESISDSLSEKGQKVSLFSRSATSIQPSKHLMIELEGIANSYNRYIASQRFKNFHGLRDYYSLVKYIAREVGKFENLSSDKKMDVVIHGLQRNFGGLPSEFGTLVEMFQGNLRCLKYQKIPVLDLIKGDIEDESARHLMVITTGDAALGILQQQLSQLHRQSEIIFGSQFEEDLTDDYGYRILSRIILCMEQGLVLILKDLESIYGSLYDMLNQNYTVAGKKKNCRVALGHYSNPMCHVHEGFRCIVLVEESKLQYTDPPFLNRFEKQNLKFSDILSVEEGEATVILTQWVYDLSTTGLFSPKDCFPVFSEDMVASVVLQVFSRECRTKEFKEIVQRCQLEMLWILKPEAVVRLQKTKLGTGKGKIAEVQEIIDTYFELPIHEGLQVFLEYELREEELSLNQAKQGKLIIVFTHSNIHTSVQKCISGLNCQFEKLGAFKSEKQLSLRIQHFWSDSEADILFLQCKPADDDAHILLSKSVIEKTRGEYIQTSGIEKPKHVVLIMHLDRTEEHCTVPQINFLSDWKLVTLDCLEKPDIPLPQMCVCTLLDAVLRKRPLNDYIQEQMFWAFSRIGYLVSGRDVDVTKDLIAHISSTKEFLTILDEEVFKLIENQQLLLVDDWQLDVACDKHALYTASSLTDALEQQILRIIDEPLAKLIFELENANVLDSFFIEDNLQSARRNAWKEMFSNPNLISTRDTPSPTLTECYMCTSPALQLKMPFANLLFKRIENTKDEFSDLLYRVLARHDMESAAELPDAVYTEIVLQHSLVIAQEIADMAVYEGWHEDYLYDFCNIMSASKTSFLSETQRVQIVRWFIEKEVTLPKEDHSEFVTRLHTTWWVHSSLYHAALQLIETCKDILNVDGEEVITEIEGEYKQEQRRHGTIPLKSGPLPVLEEGDTWSRTFRGRAEVDEECGVHLMQATNAVPVQNTDVVQSDGVGLTVDDETSPVMTPHSFLGVESRLSLAIPVEGEKNSSEMCMAEQIVLEGDPRLEPVMAMEYSGVDTSQIDLEDYQREPDTAAEDGVNTSGLQNDVESRLSVTIPDEGKKDTSEVCIAEEIVIEEDQIKELSVTVGDRCLNTSEPKNVLKTDQIEELQIAVDDNTVTNRAQIVLHVDQRQGPDIAVGDSLVGAVGSQRVLEEDQREQPDITITAQDSHVNNSESENRMVCLRSSAMLFEKEDLRAEKDIRMSEIIQEDDFNNFGAEFLEVEMGVEPRKGISEEPLEHGDLTEDTATIELALLADANMEEQNESTARFNDSIDDAESVEETGETSKVKLVRYVCKKLIPTNCVLEKMHGNLEVWQQRASCVLSLSAQISVDPCILHSLRFCNDVVSFILSHDIPGTKAVQAIGSQLAENMKNLDSNEVSQLVLDMLEAFTCSLQSNDVTKLLSSYLSRCISADPDSQIMVWLFKAIAEQTLPTVDFSFLKAPLHHAMQVELSCEPGIIVDLLDDSAGALETIEENCFFGALDSCLSELFSDTLLNTEFIVLMVDLFEGYFSNKVIHKGNIENLKATDKHILRLLEAGRIVDSNDFGLKTIVAVAYYKCFVKNLAVCLEVQTFNCVPFSGSLQSLNAIFSAGDVDEIDQLKVFFLKQIGKGKIRNNLCKAVELLAGEMPSLKKTDWLQLDHVASVDGNLFGLHIPDFLPVVLKAMVALQRDGKDRIELVLQLIVNATDGPKEMMCLHYIAMSYFYLKSSISALNYTARSVGELILNFIKEKELDNNSQKLLFYLFTREDFQIEELLLHPESSQEQVLLSTILVHLFILLTSYSSNKDNKKQLPFFIQNLEQPGSLQMNFVPGHPDRYLSTSPQGTYQTLTSRVVKVHNTCFQRCILRRDQTASIVCPICKSDRNHVEEEDDAADICKVKHLPGFHHEKDVDMDIVLKERNLSAISYHVLNIMVKGCLLGSIALGYTTESDIQALLTHKVRTESAQETVDKDLPSEDDVGKATWLVTSIQKHWGSISTLLGIPDSVVSLLLQIILLETRNSLCEDPRQMISVEERDLWEKDFTEIVDHIVSNRFEKIRKALIAVYNIYGFPDDSEEIVLLELEKISLKRVNERNRMKELYRLTSDPSLEGLQSELQLEQKTAKFPFLSLTLRHLKLLKVVQHIIPIIKWHLISVSHASYLMKKRECMESKVVDFLHREEADKQRVVKRRFEEFQKAWQDLKEQNHVLQTFDEAIPHLQRIHFQTKLTEVLILNQESPVYLVLKVLVHMQNWFLDEALKASAVTDCMALSFLKKEAGVAAVPTMPLLEAKADQVIKFSWTDDLLKFSQCDLRYGCGQKVLYDFGKMETELAIKILMNKAHLSMARSLPKVIFTDELFQSYAVMIVEFKKIIPQRPLTPEIRVGIEKKKENSPKQILELLVQLGILLSLLKRTSGDPDLPLIDYLEKWSNILTRPFQRSLLPSPESAIKLCHIVSLHELLEELNADAMIESLEDEYRLELDFELKSSLEQTVSGNTKVAELTLRATKRFIHRCLSSREADLNLSLYSYLSNESFWPDGIVEKDCLRVGTLTLPLPDLFPQGLMVQHIYCTVQFLVHKIEESQQKETRVTSMMSSFKGQSKAVVAKTKRKKAAKGYSAA